MGRCSLPGVMLDALRIGDYQEHPNLGEVISCRQHERGIGLFRWHLMDMA